MLNFVTLAVIACLCTVILVSIHRKLKITSINNPVRGRILDGKRTSSEIREELKQNIELRKKREMTIPQLDVILVGDDPASKIYVKIKEKACESVGILSRCHYLPAETTKEELLKVITQLNARKKTQGILLQQPLPPHLNPDDFSETISAEKDVDGFNPINFGRLGLRYPVLSPCTSRGVMTLINNAKINIAGKHAVIVGCSNLVGRPMALELMLARCTVTICNSITENLKQHIKSADILISAMGKTDIIKSRWIKIGAIVIDIGINQKKDNSIVGDIDFKSAKKRASWITPVPGGVGPMTVVTLLQNTLKATEINESNQASKVYYYHPSHL